MISVYTTAEKRKKKKVGENYIIYLKLSDGSRLKIQEEGTAGKISITPIGDNANQIVYQAQAPNVLVLKSIKDWI